MSSKSKGDYYERKAQAQLEAEGYEVERAHAKVVWIPDGKGGRRPISQHHDFFGKFDLIAVKKDEVRFIQVKFLDEDSNLKEARANILDFQHKCEMWLYEKKLGKVQRTIWESEK